MNKPHSCLRARWPCWQRLPALAAEKIQVVEHADTDTTIDLGRQR